MSAIDEVIGSYVIIENAKGIREFAEWIVNRCDDTNGVDMDIGNGGSGTKYLDEVIMREEPNPIEAVVEFTYPGILHSPSDPQIFKDRAILAPTNEMVDAINDHAMSLIPAKERVYLSSDNVCEENGEIDLDSEVFSVESLNKIKCSGFPNHEIKLKEGCIIMLLRDIFPSNGICNGTRMMVTKLGKHVIEACLISGSNAGEKFVIGRIKMSSSDYTKFPIRFQRRQFPVAVCYAMTINKSQGQSISYVGLYVPKSMFRFGQMGIAVSQINSKKGVKVFICDESGKMRYTVRRTRIIV